MNEMRKLLNIMESATVKEDEKNRRGPPQQGTREFEEMHQALAKLGRLRRYVAGMYDRWPNYEADVMIGTLLHIKERLRWPMQILDRMVTDESGREFRLSNQSWGVLADGDKADFQELITNTNPERIQSMFKEMDRNLANLVNTVDPTIRTIPFIK